VRREVCPTQAIEKLSESLKKETKIGIAKIQKDICVSMERRIRMPCLRRTLSGCSSKAIKLQKITVNGNEVQAPYVEEELCVGCSICENKCPASNNNKKGIVVEPI
jgi:translation initiation factor RLI1